MLSDLPFSGRHRIAMSQRQQLPSPSHQLQYLHRLNPLLLQQWRKKKRKSSQLQKTRRFDQAFFSDFGLCANMTH